MKSYPMQLEQVTVFKGVSEVTSVCVCVFVCVTVHFMNAAVICSDVLKLCCMLSLALSFSPPLFSLIYN